MILYAKGLAPVNCPSWAAGRMLFLQSKPVWVDSSIGVDDSLHGDSKELPCATLAYAASKCWSDNPTNQNYIILSENHDEDITSVVTIPNRVHIMGMGRALSGKRATLRVYGLGGVRLHAHVNSGSSAKIENVKFWFNSSLFCLSAMAYGTSEVSIENCEFELGPLCSDSARAVVLADVLGGILTVKDTKFTVLQGRTPSYAGPVSVYMSYVANSRIFMDGVTLDAGGVSALSLDIASGSYSGFAKNMTVANGAKLTVNVPDSGSEYQFEVSVLHKTADSMVIVS